MADNTHPKMVTAKEAMQKTLTSFGLLAKGTTSQSTPHAGSTTETQETNTQQGFQWTPEKFTDSGYLTGGSLLFDSVLRGAQEEISKRDNVDPYEYRSSTASTPDSQDDLSVVTTKVLHLLDKEELKVLVNPEVPHEAIEPFSAKLLLTIGSQIS